MDGGEGTGSSVVLGRFLAVGPFPCPTLPGARSSHLLLCGEGFNDEFILVVDVGLFRVSVSSSVSFGNLGLSRGLPIFANCQTYQHKVVNNVFLFPF